MARRINCYKGRCGRVVQLCSLVKEPMVYKIRAIMNITVLATKAPAIMTDAASDIPEVVSYTLSFPTHLAIRKSPILLLNFMRSGWGAMKRTEIKNAYYFPYCGFVHNLFIIYI